MQLILLIPKQTLLQVLGSSFQIIQHSLTLLRSKHATTRENFGPKTLTRLTPCSTESRYTATLETIHVVSASSTVQAWVTSALIDI